jgi:phosphoribosylanthranilate isomerase
MHRTRVKICGICRPVDALAAANAGADAIGLVFHPAAGRCVSVEDAAQIVAALPPMVVPVGLFVDVALAQIRDVLKHVPLAAVQLHGNESPQLIAELKPTPVIKAVRVDTQLTNTLQSLRRAIVELNLTNLTGIVMETATATAPGGTGIANDWSALKALKDMGGFEGLPCLIAAGGLTPQNVGHVIRSIQPYAVDVSSGVESVRREKANDKLHSFFRAVRDADQSPKAD